MKKLKILTDCNPQTWPFDPRYVFVYIFGSRILFCILLASSSLEVDHAVGWVGRRRHFVFVYIFSVSIWREKLETEMFASRNFWTEWKSQLGIEHSVVKLDKNEWWFEKWVDPRKLLRDSYNFTKNSLKNCNGKKKLNYPIFIWKL